MATHQLVLALRSTVAAETGAETIDSHGVVQLGMITANQTRVLAESVQVRHEGYPPVYNLALSSPTPPAWLPNLLIAYTGSPVPAIPGLGALPFIPGPLWISPSIPGPLAPLDVFTAGASAATHVPGGFLFFSNPGSMHSLLITGAVPSGLNQGVYSHNIYISGSLAPVGPRINIARVAIALHVQRET